MKPEDFYTGAFVIGVVAIVAWFLLAVWSVVGWWLFAAPLLVLGVGALGKVVNKVADWHPY